MKKIVKLPALASLCFFGLGGVMTQAQLSGPFSCFGTFVYDDYDAEPAASASYDILVIYKNVNTGTSLYPHYGWGEDLPNSTLTSLDDFILESDSRTYAAQWDDHDSVNPRTDWTSPDITIYF